MVALIKEPVAGIGVQLSIGKFQGLRCDRAREFSRADLVDDPGSEPADDAAGKSGPAFRRAPPSR